MALRTVTMAELRLEVLLEAENSGESATEFCRSYKISRETYYRYRRRYLAARNRGTRGPLAPPKSARAQIDGVLETERFCCTGAGWWVAVNVVGWFLVLVR